MTLSGPSAFCAGRHSRQAPLSVTCVPPSLASCPSVVGAATRLYYNRELGRNRSGLGGKTAGSPRRFLDILSQLELNWDLHSLTIDELLGLLPSEFDHFSRISQQKNLSDHCLMDLILNFQKNTGGWFAVKTPR